MSTIDLSDYKQLPTVQAELSDLQLNTLGVAEFIVEHLREDYPELDEGDFIRVEVRGTIEGYFIGRIAEFNHSTLTATITLIRS